MKQLFAFPLLALAFACAPTAEPPAAPNPPPAAENPSSPDTCGMARFQHLIGTPASQIDRGALPPRTRIITPGMMVTQDFSAGRLNIMTGVDGRVSSLRCF